MDKTKMFMVVTAMISVVCFNFNKILETVLSLVFENVYDESVLLYGPYMKSKPITVECVMIDVHVFTNKTRLLLNWRWDFDILGFTTSDILMMKPDASSMVIQYKKKYGPCPSQTHTVTVDFKNNTVTEKGKTSDILFEEICLFK
jgi:hypothetical protein